MTSIDGLFAILEDRGLMPAVALFSLSAVLGLLYLSSGNLKAPNPHLRQDVDARHSMRSDMARLPIRGMTLNRAWTAYLHASPSPAFRDNGYQSCGFVEKGHSREGK